MPYACPDLAEVAWIAHALGGHSRTQARARLLDDPAYFSRTVTQTSFASAVAAVRAERAALCLTEAPLSVPLSYEDR